MLEGFFCEIDNFDARRKYHFNTKCLQNKTSVKSVKFGKTLTIFFL